MALGSGIRKKSITDPGSRGQKGTGSRIRIRNTGCNNAFVRQTAERVLRLLRSQNKPFKKRKTLHIIFDKKTLTTLKVGRPGK
jgi:hypothetical protein